MLADITPLILTFNEAPNIARTLERLAWARRIVVVDSFSSDGTIEICRRFPQVEVVQRAFDSHAAQWNFGLGLIATPWVLTLDADYVLNDELAGELEALREPSADGYFARFRYCVMGGPLRGSIYPPRLLLFRRDRGTYVQDGHTQRLQFAGRTGWLSGTVLHDDRKPLDRWFADQCRYAAQEAQHLARTRPDQLNPADRLRRLVVLAPLLVPIYVLVGHRALLDGRAGWYYAGQRMLAELLLALRLLDARLRATGADLR